METAQKGLSTPVAIIIAGVLIAIAVFFGISKSGNTSNTDANAPAAEISGVQEGDHIIGNPDAKIVIVEYSDTECPYCGIHQERMHELLSNYDPSEVAWVYRHFPIHSKSPKEAQATECAAELGGEDAFWNLLDMIYERTPANDGLDLAVLPDYAEEVGVDRAAFESCLASDRHQDILEAQFNEVVAAGGRGTPHNIFLVGGEQIALEGTQPIETLKQVVDQLLAQ